MNKLNTTDDIDKVVVEKIDKDLWKIKIFLGDCVKIWNFRFHELPNALRTLGNNFE